MTITDRILEGLKIIKTKQDELKNSLSKKGITIANDDHIPELVDKVENIKNNPYFAKGTTFPISSSNVFLLENLNRKPIEFGFLSEDLINGKVYSVTDGYVVPSLRATFTSDSVKVGDCTVTRLYDGDMWSIKCEFPKENTYFQGGFEYDWAVTFDEQI